MVKFEAFELDLIETQEATFLEELASLRLEVEDEIASIRAELGSLVVSNRSLTLELAELRRDKKASERAGVDKVRAAAAARWEARLSDEHDRRREAAPRGPASRHRKGTRGGVSTAAERGRRLALTL